ncbi:MAG TPA: hypothetical protein VI757_00450, partial [Bacteroidia bacterium]|nr:hypothetical protein [Bacteroidia bacterium]
MKNYFALVFVIASVFLSNVAIAQREGYLQMFGNIRKDQKNLEGAEIKISRNNADIQTLYTTSNGKFVFNLPLNGEFLVTISKPGLFSKSVSISTSVPEDDKEIIFSYKFNVDLIAVIGDVAQSEALAKPIAKIAYNKTFQDFDYDQEYTKQTKTQVDQILKDAEMKARADSTATAQAEKRRRDEAEQTRLEAERKHKADSTASA